MNDAERKRRRKLGDQFRAQRKRDQPYLNILMGMGDALADQAFGEHSSAHAMESVRDATWDLAEIYLAANGFSKKHDQLTNFAFSEPGKHLVAVGVSADDEVTIGYHMAMRALFGDKLRVVRLTNGTTKEVGEIWKQLPDGHMTGAVVPTFQIDLVDDQLVWEGWVDEVAKNKPRRKNPASPPAQVYKSNGCTCANPSHHWPKSEVQSLLFDKGQFTEAQAKAWAKEHGYLYGSVDTTGSYHRLRQESPQGGPCRTIEFGHGIKAIVCAAGHGLPPGVPER